jgi:hypothetical protein
MLLEVFQPLQFLKFHTKTKKIILNIPKDKNNNQDLE